MAGTEVDLAALRNHAKLVDGKQAQAIRQALHPEEFPVAATSGAVTGQSASSVSESPVGGPSIDALKNQAALVNGSQYQAIHQSLTDANRQHSA